MEETTDASTRSSHSWGNLVQMKMVMMRMFQEIDRAVGLTT